MQKYSLKLFFVHNTYFAQEKHNFVNLVSTLFMFYSSLTSHCLFVLSLTPKEKHLNHLVSSFSTNYQGDQIIITRLLLLHVNAHRNLPDNVRPPLKKTSLDCGDDKYPDDPESRCSKSSHCLQYNGLASGPRGVRLTSSNDDEISGIAPP